LPNALPAVANYANNNTSLWTPNGSGGSVPIVTGVAQIVGGTGITVDPSGGTGVVTLSATNATYHTTVILDGGADASGVVLDCSNALMFPPNTEYYFTMVGTYQAEGTSTCDTTQGQLSATGIFSILPNGSVGFIAGSAVNTSPAQLINPGNFYLDSPGSSIIILTSSAADFIGCTFQFVWTEVIQI
jgi:hypothetical protein